VQPSSTPAISFEGVSLAFDDHVVLRDLSFDVAEGSMRILLGASGAGKSLVLKLILGLIRPDAGTIRLKGQRIDDLSEDELLRIRANLGMVFQENALFDSLTVGENVGYRLFEEGTVPPDQIRGRVEEVLAFLGLSDLIDRMPASLSGGQRRRVGIGRAMASKPHLMLFDDSTTGLDPVISATVDDEIVKLRDVEKVTAIVVTQQIRDAFYIANHRAARTERGIAVEPSDDASAAVVEFMVLHEGGILFEGGAGELLASTDPYLQRFLYRTLPPW